MTLKEYLKGRSLRQFSEACGASKSQMSRLANGEGFPGRDLAVEIVAQSGGEVSLNDLFKLPKKWWGNK